MFYLDAIGKKLRFGDVLKGYLLTTPKISKPFDEGGKDPYNIDIYLPEFSVVMDPCCHIGGGSISLTPLIQVKYHFWDTPYLVKDMTRLNRKVMPKDLMHPVIWNKLSNEEKLMSINATPDYGHKNYFIYEESSVFTNYPVKRDLQYNEVVDSDSKLPKYEEEKRQKVIDTRFYMIDFKNIHHLNCEKIFGPEKVTDEKILGSIVLQLSIRTRNELRDKMAYYFGNPPDEDRIDV
jgi:hypothetical protein